MFEDVTRAQKFEEFNKTIFNNKELYAIYNKNLSATLHTLQLMGLNPSDYQDREDLKHVVKLSVSNTIMDMVKCQLLK